MSGTIEFFAICDYCCLGSSVRRANAFQLRIVRLSVKFGRSARQISYGRFSGLATSPNQIPANFLRQHRIYLLLALFVSGSNNQTWTSESTYRSMTPTQIPNGTTLKSRSTEAGANEPLPGTTSSASMALYLKSPHLQRLSFRRLSRKLASKHMRTGLNTKILTSYMT